MLLSVAPVQFPQQNTTAALRFPFHLMEHPMVKYGWSVTFRCVRSTPPTRITASKPLTCPPFQYLQIDDNRMYTLESTHPFNDDVRTNADCWNNITCTSPGSTLWLLNGWYQVDTLSALTIAGSTFTGDDDFNQTAYGNSVVMSFIKRGYDVYSGWAVTFQCSQSRPRPDTILIPG
eukprot:PhF_6_TR25644/c0_g2_i7/m.36086